MSYVVIEDFRSGLDVRRAAISGVPGSLRELTNAHITRGGDIEARKEFVPTFTLPAGTFGCRGVAGELLTFGSEPEPTMPVGVSYQRLRHPYDVAMTALLWTEVYGGSVYAIAEYADDSVYHFFDGERVRELDDGVVIAAMTDNAGIAAHLAEAIAARGAYEVSSSGAVVTITGLDEDDFEAETVVENGGSVDDQTAVLTVTQEAVATVDGTVASMTFDILGGTEGDTNAVTSIKVNSVEILGAAGNVELTGGTKNHYGEFDSSDATAMFNGNTSTLVGVTNAIPPGGSDSITIGAGRQFPTTKSITGYTVWYRGAGTITIATSDNGSSWTTRATHSVNSPSSTASVSQSGGWTTINAKYMRAIFVSTYENVSEHSTIDHTASLAEIRFFTSNLAVLWSSSNALTAAAIAAQINSYTSTPNYTAAANSNTVTISALEGAGTGINGANVEVTVTGDVRVGTGGFTITGGTSNPGTNRITQVSVGGTNLMSGAVNWATSHSVFATAIAANINANGSVNATWRAIAEGATVYLHRYVSDKDAPNALAVIVTSGGDVTTAGVTSADTTVEAIDGGALEVPGQPKSLQVMIGGTFDPGDRFTIKLGGTSYGADDKPRVKGRSARTHQSKIYTTAGSLLQFSGANAPTVWGSDDPESPGAGFIDMNNNSAGSEELTVAAPYQGNLAVFAENAIQVWATDVDDTNNRQAQLLENTGTVSPRSVITYGNNDVFYLDDTGVRSLRARDSSNAAFVSDVGTAIDPLVRQHLDSLTDAEIRAAVAGIEPLDGRYLLAIGPKVFVFSFFPGSKISAWSTYETDFTITDFAALGSRLYARAGNVIYLYGGPDNDTYPAADAAPVTVLLPYLTAGKVASFKKLLAFDAGLEGSWDVQVLLDPRAGHETAGTGLFTLTESTYPSARVGVPAKSTHFAPKLVCSAGGRAFLSSLVLHFEGAEED